MYLKYFPIIKGLVLFNSPVHANIFTSLFLQYYLSKSLFQDIKSSKSSSMMNKNYNIIIIIFNKISDIKLIFCFQKIIVQVFFNGLLYYYVIEVQSVAVKDGITLNCSSRSLTTICTYIINYYKLKLIGNLRRDDCSIFCSNTIHCICLF
jgi:hypothetical protein